MIKLLALRSTLTTVINDDVVLLNYKLTVRPD